jgi:hypothetical protein
MQNQSVGLKWLMIFDMIRLFPSTRNTFRLKCSLHVLLLTQCSSVVVLGEAILGFLRSCSFHTGSHKFVQTVTFTFILQLHVIPELSPNFQLIYCLDCICPFFKRSADDLQLLISDQPSNKVLCFGCLEI